jgi:integrase
LAGKMLTARTVEIAQPKRNAAGQPVRTEIPDGTGLGLYLTIEATGAKSWYRRFRDSSGKPKRVKLGDVGQLTLAAARHAATSARLRSERQGGNGVVPVVVAGGDRVEVAVAQFLDKHAYAKNRHSTAWAAERIFNRLVLPAWRGRTVGSITRRDVIDLAEHVASDRPYLANRMLGVVHKFFAWLCARDALAVNPASGVERPHEEKARERTLTDAELRALWLVGEGNVFGLALRLMLLTGARRNEVSRIRWVEIDEASRLWTIPAERSKNGRAHAVPFSPQAWAIITSMPRLADCPYIFTADGRKPITGWAKAKTRLSAKANIAEESWRLHDLRRTAASGMQRLGVSVPVVEKALNHVSGTFRGIVGVYQTHDYRDEVRDALQRWANHVEGVVSGKPAEVVPIHGRRR